MIKLTERFYPDIYNGKTLDEAPLDASVNMNLCLLVDDSPYLIADKRGKFLRVFVDWVDRTDLWQGRKVIRSEFDSTKYSYNLYFKPTVDEIKLVRLLRKLTKFPNGRVIL